MKEFRCPQCGHVLREVKVLPMTGGHKRNIHRYHCDGCGHEEAQVITPEEKYVSDISALEREKQKRLKDKQDIENNNL